MELDKRYIIGIDLGTTNSAVSYVDLLTDQNQSIQLFRIPQLIGPGEFAPLKSLPSFLYIPGQYDISADTAVLPWKNEDDNFSGAFARDHGAKVPARLVASAKSWLCHSGVDRHAAILPWGSGSEINKISPIDAASAYLKHIRRAWNHAKGDDADLYLENQMIIITVPASFDEVARDLTLEAANRAGLGVVTLIEEPLAAFYNWLIRNEHRWNELVQPNELILVCDVGGGTTDFTLITLRESEGTPRFERIAVGDHLILGGDNIDLALARRLEAGLKGKRKSGLSGDRWKTLCHQCRHAKEQILDNRVDSKKIILMGTGGKLISNTISGTLDRDEVEDIVLNGFFPIVEPEIEPAGSTRKGITEFGLPYEQEAAITKHIGLFLERHRHNVVALLHKKDPIPDLILFNGGTLKAPVVQERIRAAIRHWFGCDDTLELPRVLKNSNLDLSVALGASYYGLVKSGRGIRVGSGSARAYYLGIQSPIKEKPRAICLVERGLDEGSHIVLEDRKFEVLTNKPVSFDIYSSSFRSGDVCGDLIEIDTSLTSLPPLHTVVRYGKKAAHTAIPVRIEAAYTEIGTLKLICQSIKSDHSWQLQFQLRDRADQSSIVEEDIFEEKEVGAVIESIKQVFTNQIDQNGLKSLSRGISDIIKRPKEKWPLSFIRSMADELLNHIPKHGICNQYENRWLNLMGFSLRPGFGDGFDEHRIRQIWKLFKIGPLHTKNLQVRLEWWIFWRRVAGGLKSGQQRQFIQDLSVSMFAAKSKIPRQEKLEIWMAVANLERLLVKDKLKWGRQLLKEINPGKAAPQELWSLARIAARELLYGPADRVIPPEEAAVWIKTLLKQKWSNPKLVGNALLQMARKTGDRVRDLDQSVLDAVMDWLSQEDEFKDHLKILNQVTPMEKQEVHRIFGESLPSGLVLRT